MQQVHPFHLAIPVIDLEKARSFYRDILGCEEGRSSDHLVDFNFFGHQVVLHLKKGGPEEVSGSSSHVDGKEVPIPHFGVVLPWNDFYNFASQLEEKQVDFMIAPYLRFEGKVGEQASMFFKDPSGNVLEFKAFRNIDQLFAK